MAMDAHYLVDASDAGCRLDAYLGSQDGMPSRSACARLIEGGSVALNGETVLSKKESVQAGRTSGRAGAWSCCRRAHSVGYPL